MDRDQFDMIAGELERILSDAPLVKIDQNGAAGLAADRLKAVLAENGFFHLAVSEEAGGIGCSIADAARLAVIVGRFATPVPLAETMLANAIITGSGRDPVDRYVAIADPVDNAAPIPFVARCEHVLSLSSEGVALYSPQRQGVTLQRNAEDGAAWVADGHLDPVFDGKPPEWLAPQTLRVLAALVRSGQMAGAMQSVLDLTLKYTSEREQFGRPLAKFEAIQHHLSDIACETAASIAAVELACDALEADPQCGDSTMEDIAIAKIRCGQAAGKVTAAAHQAQGAMGFTYEYALGRFTRRLWQWQDEYGSETDWAIWLGQRVLKGTESKLWPHISRPI